MILAEKIINERKKNGWSQEDLAEKVSVSWQAISKRESAQATPDLSKVILLAELFGVSTDYLLKDEIEPEDAAPTETVESNGKHVVTMEEANDYLSTQRQSARTIALGVLLCVLCPALLILLGGLAEYGGPISEGVAVALGMVALFGLIAIGVVLFIVTGIRTSRFNVWHTEGFETAYGVSGMVKEKRRAHEQTYTVGLTVGIVLCILAVLPLIVAGAMNVSDRILTVFLSMMFPIIAVGVYLIVRVGVVRGSFTFLLNEIETSEEAKKQNKTEEALTSVYWCVAIAGYLTWSFLTGDWGTTWIIWPIAGVLFGAVSAIWRLILGSEKDKNGKGKN